MDPTTQPQGEPAISTPAPEQGPAAAPWSLGRCIVFRFICCYFLLYVAPDPPGRLDLVDAVPGGHLAANAYAGLWHNLVPWVAVHIFHLSGRATTYFPTGSDDTTKDYIQNLLFVVFAAVAALVWSLVDRKRREYPRLDSWLRLAVRYTLAFTLFTYGFVKVFPLQFQPPGFDQLIQPYGDYSPMGALWNFMGASMPYTIFAGMCEALGGALLLFRRTTALGAMVSFGVLLNIALLNFCYDVPVKLYSTNLVLMAIFLAAPDLRRLMNFLVLNRATEPSDLSAPRFERRWMRIGAVVFQLLFVGRYIYSQIEGGWTAYRAAYVNPKRPPLYGLYDVDGFSRNGRELLPLTTDVARWKKVVVQYPEFFIVRMMNDSPKGYRAEYDAQKNTVALSTWANQNSKSVLVYSLPDADHVVLQGALGADTVSIRLRKVDASKFLLVNRGFHWVNEQAFNR
jgi:uncharacterized membrane protein YphA (DoxX/SURF4 family)